MGEVLKQAQDRIKAEGMCRGIKYLAFGSQAFLKFLQS